MQHPIFKDLPELVAAGIINDDVAARIRDHYLKKEQQAPNRLVLVFGILGALLVGLGIILIIAHNWDQFSRPVKLFFALLPLLFGQLICAYTLLKRSDSAVWRESGTVFVFFAVGASISIVSQVYNIPGNLEGFLLVWMLLSIPLIYVLKSAMTSLLVIAGITWYACEVSYFGYPNEIAWYYWLMLATVIPFFIQLANRKGRNFFYFHSWFLALSAIITLGMFGDGDGNFMFIAYMSLFSLFVLIGETPWFSEARLLSNAFLVTGSLGSTVLMLFFSFEWGWNEIAKGSLSGGEEFVVAGLLSLLAVGMLVNRILRSGFPTHPNAYVFLIFLALFMVARFQPGVAQWSTNLVVLAMAVVTTWRGAERDSLLILNYGLIILASLVLCRFFDTDLSFVVRGLMFVTVGLSFFAANYWLLKKRKLQHT